MKGRIFFLALLLLCTGSLFGQSGYERDTLWQKDIKEFQRNDREDSPEKGGVLFLGSSSFRAWDTLEEDFSDYNVLNRAFGGSHLLDVIHYFDEIVLPYQPCQILVYEGDNDIASGKTPEEYLEDVITFVRLVEIHLPGTKIDFVSTKPSPAREKYSENYRKANALVREFCMERPHLRFIDVEQLMYDANGLIKEDLFIGDMIHMNEEGYDLWRKVVRPYLSECAKKE